MSQYMDIYMSHFNTDNFAIYCPPDDLENEIMLFINNKAVSTRHKYLIISQHGDILFDSAGYFFSESVLDYNPVLYKSYIQTGLIGVTKVNLSDICNQPTNSLFYYYKYKRCHYKSFDFDAIINSGTTLIKSTITEGEMDCMNTDLERILSKLSEKERKIVIFRFGLEDGYAHTLEETAAFLNDGTTPERLRMMEMKIMNLLRHDGNLNSIRSYIE